MAWNDRQYRVWQFSLYHMKISAADAADMNFDKNLIGPWNRNRTLLKLQRIAGDWTRLIEDHRFHDRLG